MNPPDQFAKDYLRPVFKSDQPCQATPSGDLREQIMDSRVPKNEREWWAAREIEKLERELAAAKKDLVIAHDGLDYRDGLRDENKLLRAELTSKAACYDIACGEVQRLRAEVERLKGEVTDWELAFQEQYARAEKAEAECVRPKSLGSWAHTCVHHNDAERKAAMCCPVCEQTRSQKIETALKDAISTYFGDDKLVTAERIEAWQAALKDNK